MDRREFFKLMGMAGAGTLAPHLAAQGPQRPRVSVRFAFLTDVHLPAKGKNEFLKQAIALAEKSLGKMDMVLFGGDNIYAADGIKKPDVIEQFINWKTVVDKALDVSHFSVLGNHDLYGSVGSTKEDRAESKAWAQSVYKMPSRYYSFTRNGWRFVALDTIQWHPTGYVCTIDEDQLQWLTTLLSQHSEPTVLFGHAPIISVNPIANAETVRTGFSTRIPFSRLLSNAREVLEILRVNPQVKLCLSGHLHMNDYVRFRGTDFVCGGAVSGGWWKTEVEHFPPSLTVVELFSNGRLFHRRIDLSSLR